jgi:hypothetical protein
MDITNIDKPEENEGLVTYTYDDYDRLLYRNVYQGDRSRRSRFFLKSDGFQPTVWEQADKIGPKKLLYQDVYSYNNSTGQKEVRRVYQPIIEISGIRDQSGYAVATANIICRSNVFASGFIYDTNKEALLQQFLYPSSERSDNLYRTATAIGKDGVGTIQTTIQNTATLYVKAYAIVETGTLFSKTIEIPESE